MNKYDAKRVYTRCIVHDNIEILNNNQLNSFAFIDCEFKGTVSVKPANIATAYESAMKFDNCVFEDLITVELSHAESYIQFNNCVFKNGYSFEGRYGATNCIINNFVPEEKVENIVINDVIEDNYIEVNKEYAFTFNVFPATITDYEVEIYDLNNILEFRVDPDNGARYLTPKSVGKTMLIVKSGDIEASLELVVVDVDYEYVRLNVDGSISEFQASYAKVGYDPVEAGATYKVSTLGRVGSMTVFQYNDNDELVNVDNFCTPVLSQTLENGETEWYITITIVEGATKIRFNPQLRRASSNNMPKVFATYKLTKLD
jgi:hypothetical protein